MRRTTSERLLILQRRQCQEQDAIITAFRPQRGLLRLWCRGLFKPQSKLAGHVEPLTIIDGLIVWGQRPLLSAAVSRQSFGQLKSQLAAVVVASQIINRYQRWLTTGQVVAEAWSDFNELLTDWDRQPLSLNILTAGSQAIQWRLGNRLGYAPDLERCVNCQQLFSTSVWWRPFDGGLVCSNCRPAAANLELSAVARQYWLRLLTDEWLELTKSPLSPTILEQQTGFFNEWVNFLDHYIC